jgi:hypothetical protein
VQHEDDVVVPTALVDVVDARAVQLDEPVRERIALARHVERELV